MFGFLYAALAIETNVAVPIATTFRSKLARMKPGKASQTAVLVCMGRAAAHDMPWANGFADPTAMALLPGSARERVEQYRSGTVPRGARARIANAYIGRQSRVMVARTTAIDEAIREAATPQVVILGAGLDGRAWRMPELRDAIVFEVDHPDSQRAKRKRVGALTQSAREVRFVAVDFARDDLEAALAAAGHDATRATTWVWEGVVMYLAQAEIEGSLAVITRRSPPGSRLVIAYHCPALALGIIGLVVRRLGEPLRSAFTPGAMRALLASYGFRTIRDSDVASIGATLSPELGRAAKVARHLRIVVADRV